jgi:hypothetical protein
LQKRRHRAPRLRRPVIFSRCNDMSAKNRKAAAQKSSPPPAAPLTAPASPGGVATVAEEPFYKRHPKIANVIFGALCIYVAMLWLLALDQTFHWGIFGPKVPPMP